MTPDTAEQHDDVSPGTVTVKAETDSGASGFLAWFRNIMKPEPENTLRETLDEYINEGEVDDMGQAAMHERMLLANILRLRDMTVVNVMVPRADIIAIDANTTQEELLALLAEKQYSRIPVYRGTLDDVLGTVHVKDVLATLARGDAIDIRSLVKEIPIVSPALPVLDLLITMREQHRHMVLVVDEFGGIDGLVTINDVIEVIVGEINDEHGNTQEVRIVQKTDGSLLVDARLAIEDFENRFGKVFSDDERATSDTLSGLVYAMEGRIPGRGEVLTHSSGMVFEVMDADRRRINLLKITNIPKAPE